MLYCVEVFFLFFFYLQDFSNFFLTFVVALIVIVV